MKIYHFDKDCVIQVSIKKLLILMTIIMNFLNFFNYRINKTTVFRRATSVLQHNNRVDKLLCLLVKRRYKKQQKLFKCITKNIYFEIK